MDNQFFDAFISYSQAVDGKLASHLQKAVTGFAKPWYRRRVSRIFRDETTLNITPELWPEIEKALTASKHFILLASPAAAASKWVQKEIEHWFQLGRKERLFIVLTEGAINWDGLSNDFDWTSTDALPRIFSGRVDAEPLYLDLSWARKEQHVSLKDPRFHQPWIFMITDGAPTESDEEVRRVGERVKEAETNKRLSFFAVGVERADMEKLRSISVRDPVNLKGLDFKAMFVWLSASMQKVSASKIGQQVPLQPVGWGAVG